MNLLASKRIDASIFPSFGIWRGSVENSLVIELEGVSGTQVDEIAEDIRRMNNQEAVLVQWIDSIFHLITRPESFSSEVHLTQ